MKKQTDTKQSPKANAVATKDLAQVRGGQAVSVNPNRRPGDARFTLG